MRVPRILVPKRTDPQILRRRAPATRLTQMGLRSRPKNCPAAWRTLGPRSRTLKPALLASSGTCDRVAGVVFRRRPFRTHHARISSFPDDRGFDCIVPRVDGEAMCAVQVKGRIWVAYS